MQIFRQKALARTGADLTQSIVQSFLLFLFVCLIVCSFVLLFSLLIIYITKTKQARNGEGHNIVRLIKALKILYITIFETQTQTPARAHNIHTMTAIN